MPSPPCQCDACRSRGPRDSSGYCAFCATRCYPAGVVGGRTLRLAMSPESRAALHAHDDVKEAPKKPDKIPQDPRVVAKAAAQEVQRRAVDAAMDAAAPVVEKAVGEVFAFVRRKLGGR